MVSKGLIAFGLASAVLTTPALASPAQPVSDVRVVRVASATGGSETISSGASITTNKHGGSWVEVTVDEIGYTTHREASFGGSSIPSSAVQSKRLLCGSTSAPTICGAYETSIGTEVVWRFDPVAIYGGTVSGTTTFSTTVNGYGAGGGNVSKNINIRF